MILRNTLRKAYVPVNKSVKQYCLFKSVNNTISAIRIQKNINIRSSTISLQFNRYACIVLLARIYLTFKK